MYTVEFKKKHGSRYRYIRTLTLVRRNQIKILIHAAVYQSSQRTVYTVHSAGTSWKKRQQQRRQRALCVAKAGDADRCTGSAEIGEDRCTKTALTSIHTHTRARAHTHAHTHTHTHTGRVRSRESCQTRKAMLAAMNVP